MRDWRKVLAKLVQFHRNPDRTLFPLCICNASTPTAETWPANLVSSPTLREFYVLCDGGHFGVNRDWLPVRELIVTRDKWVDMLRDEGLLDPQRHLMLAYDAGGDPYVWAADTDHVFTYELDGGRWTLDTSSLDQFLAALVNPTQAADGLWYEALQQLDRL